MPDQNLIDHLIEAVAIYFNRDDPSARQRVARQPDSHLSSHDHHVAQTLSGRKMSELDRVIYRQDLYKEMQISSETVRRWMKSGKLPAPDVAISQKTTGWRLSTLNAAGIGIV